MFHGIPNLYFQRKLFSNSFFENYLVNATLKKS